MKKIRISDVIYNHKRSFILINNTDIDKNIFENIFGCELVLENQNSIPIEVELFNRYKLQGEYAWILESKTTALLDYIEYPFKENNVYLNITK